VRRKPGDINLDLPELPWLNFLICDAYVFQRLTVKALPDDAGLTVFSTFEPQHTPLPDEGKPVLWRSQSKDPD
jgi:hypothetical protein